jgi:hypothetical protein
MRKEQQQPLRRPTLHFDNDTTAVGFDRLQMGRLTGSPIGGEVGRAFKREWEDSAAAMPQPLSEENKELLREAYIDGYWTHLGIIRTRKHATEAVKNIGKKKTGQINVRRAVCLRLFLFHSNPRW